MTGHGGNPFLAIGPYRVVIAKQVGEEAISIEFYRQTQAEAEVDLASFMVAIQKEREKHNARVLESNQSHLALILQKTQNAEEELARVTTALRDAGDQLDGANGDARGSA